MPDNDNDTPAPPPSLAFTPVPRQCERHDGWTPERQILFIEALADYGSVRAACECVGLATVGAYRLRRQPGAESFAAAWEAALGHGIQRLEDALMDRALNGTEEELYYHGELRAKRRRYNDRLGMFMLRNRAPHRFAAGGGAKGLNAIGKMEQKRLEKQLREQWEREQREAEEEQDREVTDGLVEKFETMHRNWYAALSPRARAAYREFRRLERADKAAGYRPYDDETAEAEAEYDAGAASLDGRAKINMLIEADGFGVDEVLASEEAQADEPAAEEEEEEEEEEEDPKSAAAPEPPAGPRVRTLKDDEW